MTWISSLCVDALILFAIIGIIFVVFEVSGINITITKEDNEQDNN